jgi:hypothetical protein
MIYGRGKCLHRVFRLTACTAARRFASCRLRVRGRRDAWRPVVLRWRQRRKRLANVPVGRAVAQSQVLWFPQFHFHFASHMSDRSRRNLMPGLSPAAGPRQTRVVMDHRWTSARTGTSPRQLGNANRRLGEIYELNSPRPKDHAPVTSALRVSWPGNDSRSEAHAPVAPAPRVSRLGNSSWSKAHTPVTTAPRVSWLTFTQPLFTWPTCRLRHQLFERMPEVRSRMQREGQTPFLQTRSQIWQHWHQVFSLRPPQSGNPVPHRASGSNALRFQNERPVELVWRHVLRTPLDSDDGKRGPEVSESSSRTQARSQPDREPAVGVAPLLERAAATQLTKLDPGVLDRLTDDVIRRVEQRMRIERQRRGL